MIANTFTPDSILLDSPHAVTAAFLMEGCPEVPTIPDQSSGHMLLVLPYHDISTANNMVISDSDPGRIQIQPDLWIRNKDQDPGRARKVEK